MPEPKIERYEVIIPSEIESDTYGNITIRTKDNKEIKINKKHESLHELIRQATSEGRAVKLGYAVYMNKEYVHTAELFDGKPPIEKQIEPITAGVGKEPLPREISPRPVMTKDDWSEKDRITRKSIERQTSLKEAVEFAKIVMTTHPEKVTTENTIATAKAFEAYLEGDADSLVKEAIKLGAIEIEKGGKDGK